jgi:glycosyltransferase involved in cell wall biosynthesis
MTGVRAGVVSTVIPVFNRPRLLAEAVQSVLAQTYRPIEIIIIDDGSSDETPTVGQAFAADHPDIVRYVPRAHQGYTAALNAGIAIAAGEFVQLLDSDDLLLPEKFARQVAGLRAHPECGISYCFIREYAIGEPSSGRPARRTGETFVELFPAILSGKIWPNPSPLFRRDVVEVSGAFANLVVHPEWEYECRAAARGVRLHHCREFLGDTRGTHRLEGRRKGGVPRDALKDYAEVLGRVLGHARAASVPAAAVDRFARRLYSAAALCAAEGFQAEARHCLMLAASAATGASIRLRIAWYGYASDRFGWQTVGRWSFAVERSGLADATRFLRYRPAALCALWKHRARIARETITGAPVGSWPVLLRDRWVHRQSARRFSP